MKTLIVYDSLYGNTEKVAQAIGGALGGEVRLVRPAAAGPADLERVDLLLVGSPTQGGRATPAMREFLDRLPGSFPEGMGVAAFDTRLTSKLVVVFGYAAGRIAGSLKDKGGRLVAPAEGFKVKGSKGPLVDGELVRAAAWARGIASVGPEAGRGAA